MKLSVIGSNTITDDTAVNFFLDREVLKGTMLVTSILGGGGKGVASIVKKYCRTNKLDFVEFIPYYLLDDTVDFSNKYFFIRNRQLVDNADKVLFIWNGDCKDVEYAIKYAQKLGRDISVVKIPKKEA